MADSVRPVAKSSNLRSYRQAARKWLADAQLPDLPADYSERFQNLRRWQSTLYRAGWVGIDWPAEYGGQGLSISHRIVFLEELARARAPHPVGLIGMDVIGPTILRFGTEKQKKRIIPSLLSGKELWCQGFSEPDAGSDLASLRTRGVVKNDHLEVTGQKVWTSWATEADWCAVLVRTDPAAPQHSGISYIMVGMRSPGVTVKPLVQITGDPEFNEIFFDGVRVPKSNVIGNLGDGWRVAMHTLGHERGGYALRRRLENERTFVDLVEELRSRRGDPTFDFSSIATTRLGSLYSRLRAFEAQANFTIQRHIDGEIPSPWDSIDKLTLSATEQELFAVALDLVPAGRRTTVSRPEEPFDSERWLKGLLYARAGSIYGGSSQIQRTIVAERLLGLPRGR